MNINHHTYETFQDRLKRLIEESGFIASEFAEKIDKSPSALSKYLSGTLQPNADTLVKIADCLNITVDYLLCRKTAVLTLQSHRDNIYIFEKMEFDFNQLTDEYDRYLTAILGNDALVKSSGKAISLVILLTTIFLRDSVSVFKNRHGFPAEECRAYLYRSEELHKVIYYLMYRLTHDIISSFSPETQTPVIDLDMKTSVMNLIKLFVKRDDVLNDIFMDNLLLTLDHSVNN